MSSKYTIKIKATLDKIDLQKQIDDLKKLINKNQKKSGDSLGVKLIDGKNLADGRKAIQDMSGAMDNIRASFAGLGENLQVSSVLDPKTENLRGYKVVFDKIGEGVKKTETFMVKINKHGKQIITNARGFEKAVSTTQKKIKDTSLSSAKISQNLTKWGDSLREMETRTPKIFEKEKIVAIRTELDGMIANFNDPSIKKTPEMVAAINAKMSHLKSTIRSTSLETQNLTHDSDTFGEVMGKNIKKVAQWAIATTAIYGSLKQIGEAVQFIKDLNKEMTNIQVVTGQTKQEVDALAKSFNETALAIGATTIEVSQSALEFIRQGKSAEESGTLVRNSMMMSKLANMESSDAANYLTSIMNGYKMTVEETTSAVDKMVAVDNASATSVAELAEALQKTSNIAQMAGVSFDDLVAYIGTVSSVTRKGARVCQLY